MPKRLIDTELWNNEQIVEEFTCDDKYFWLYLLTSPHGSICGVMRYSPAIIGRDMGLHKDTIENLVYRFENNYKLIVVDKETKELLILNWYKWNWSTSGKLLQSVINSKETIKSVFIQELVQERIDFVTGKIDRVSIPYAYPTISNTITNTNSIENSICKENYNKRNENIVQPSFLANDENQVQNEKVDLETVTLTSTSSLIETNEQPSSQQKANKGTDAIVISALNDIYTKIEFMYKKCGYKDKLAKKDTITRLKTICNNTNKSKRLHPLQILLSYGAYLAECRKYGKDVQYVKQSNFFLTSMVYDYAEKTASDFEQRVVEKYGDGWKKYKVVD